MLIEHPVCKFGSYSYPMCDLKVLLAGKLVVGVLDVLQDLVRTRPEYAMFSQHALQVLLVPVAEWTA